MRAANSDYTWCSILKAKQNRCFPPSSAGNDQLRIWSINPYLPQIFAAGSPVRGRSSGFKVIKESYNEMFWSENITSTLPYISQYLAFVTSPVKSLIHVSMTLMQLITFLGSPFPERL